MFKRIIRAAIVSVLTAEARLVLWRHAPMIIAVTGNLGKTTTKDAIFAAISSSKRARKSEKSFNSEIGVPLTILGLDNPWSDPFRWIGTFIKGSFVIFSSSYPELLVLEVGADKPGDIRSIASWLRPDIAVFTGVPNIPVHVEYFESRDALVAEKRSLFEYLKEGGTIVANGDDPSTKETLHDIKAEIVTFGFDPNNTVSASAERVIYEDGMPVGEAARLSHAEGAAEVSMRGALGRPRMYAALAALAVAQILDVDSAVAISALAACTPTPGRMRLIKGVSGSVIVDDTYNASPTAVLSALDTIADLGFAKRRIAVLGDMFELGKYFEEAHKEVGIRVAATCDFLFAVGEKAQVIAQAAREVGMAHDHIREFKELDATRAGTELAKDLHEGDVVLVKGSQGMRMERIVEALMAEPSRAKELLVRQDEEWKKKK